MTLLFVVIDTPVMEILLTALLASLWCLGLWSVTEPGKLLSFIKQPLLNKIEARQKEYADKVNKALETYQKRTVSCSDTDKEYYKFQKDSEIEELKEKHDLFKKNMKLLNPIILCPVCMGSVHGLGLFSLCQPMSWWVIPVMFMTAGLNKIWHERLI